MTPLFPSVLHRSYSSVSQFAAFNPPHPPYTPGRILPHLMHLTVDVHFCENHTHVSLFLIHSYTSNNRRHISARFQVQRLLSHWFSVTVWSMWSPLQPSINIRLWMPDTVTHSLRSLKLKQSIIRSGQYFTWEQEGLGVEVLVYAWMHHVRGLDAVETLCRVQEQLI